MIQMILRIQRHIEVEFFRTIVLKRMRHPIIGEKPVMPATEILKNENGQELGLEV